jgi:integrase
LERYVAHVHACELSTGQKRRLLGNLRTFLDDVRMHEWALGLAGNATYFDGEIPRGSTRRLPRFIDEYVIGQIEHPDNLARRPDPTTRTAIVILIETGLRSIDALRLRFDPITFDAPGAPYLVYTNHKLAREAVIPISQPGRRPAVLRLQRSDTRPATSSGFRYEGNRLGRRSSSLRQRAHARTRSSPRSRRRWSDCRTASPAGP